MVVRNLCKVGHGRPDPRLGLVASPYSGFQAQGEGRNGLLGMGVGWGGWWSQLSRATLGGRTHCCQRAVVGGSTNPVGVLPGAGAWALLSLGPEPGEQSLG